MYVIVLWFRMGRCRFEPIQRYAYTEDVYENRTGESGKMKSHNNNKKKQSINIEVNHDDVFISLLSLFLSKG